MNNIRTLANKNSKPDACRNKDGRAGRFKVWIRKWMSGSMIRTRPGIGEKFERSALSNY